jgi:hypothetical protein
VRGTDKKKREYAAPSIVVLGSLHQLTLDTKIGAFCDVTCYHQGSG